MPREATLLTRIPLGLDQLVRLIDQSDRPLGVQGIDGGITAAVLHPDGRIACTLSAPLRLLSPLEFERVMPGVSLDEEQDLFWHAATTPIDDDGLGVALLDRLAAMGEGRVILAPRLQLDAADA